MDEGKEGDHHDDLAKSRTRDPSFSNHSMQTTEGVWRNRTDSGTILKFEGYQGTLAFFGPDYYFNAQWGMGKL